jgi:hypothetical protein
VHYAPFAINKSKIFFHYFLPFPVHSASPKRGNDMAQTFESTFQARLDALEKEAKKHGTHLTALCKAAGISRSTPDRWRRTPPPSTIAKLDDLAKALADHIAQNKKEPSKKVAG